MGPCGLRVRAQHTTFGTKTGGRLRRWGASSLGKIRHLIFAVFLGAALTVTTAPGTASAAEEIPGAFKAPAVGTVAEFTDFKFIVREVNGIDIEYEGRRLGEDFLGKGAFRDYGWFLSVAASPRDKPRFDASRLDVLYPLRVGDTSSVRLQVGTRAWKIDYEIARTETIIVPAGTFFAFVIEAAWSGVGNSYRLVKTNWYAPEVGLIVKSDRKITGGTGFGKERHYELVRLLDPDGKQLFPVPEPESVVIVAGETTALPVIKLTAADGQELFDAGDYAGAVNAWFSAAQVGDALAMLNSVRCTRRAWASRNPSCGRICFTTSPPPRAMRGRARPATPLPRK